MKRHATDDSTRYSISIRHTQNQEKMGVAFYLTAGPHPALPFKRHFNAIFILTTLMAESAKGGREA
jgi:hypothetical protein